MFDTRPPVRTGRRGRLSRRHRWMSGAFALCSATIVVLAMAVPANAAPAPTTGAPAKAPATLKPTVKSALKHDSSPALRSIKPAHVVQPKAKTKQVQTLAVPHAKNLAAKPGSADVQSSVIADTMPAFQKNFEGVGNVNCVLPPDTQGDVGPNNYVQMVNLSFAVYDKQGNLQLGPLPNNALWQGFGGPCETFNGGDPVTMYDEAANRWFMSQLAYPGGSQGFHECIAVSQTPDPTGAWFRYDFLFSTTTLNDYPKFGIWPDAYYASYNEFLNEATFTGVSTVAYERDKMLLGQDARQVTFHIGTQFGSLLPSDAEGSALGFAPPAGAPDPFLMFDDNSFGVSPTDRVDMWDFH